MLTKKYPHEGQTDVEIILNAHGDDHTRLSIPESIPDEFKELLYGEPTPQNLIRDMAYF